MRLLLAQHGRLAVDASKLAVDADLYRAGLGSQASVTLMLALEQAFGVEFPEELLHRQTFESIGAIVAAVSRLKQGGE